MRRLWMGLLLGLVACGAKKPPVPAMPEEVRQMPVDPVSCEAFGEATPAVREGGSWQLGHGEAPSEGAARNRALNSVMSEVMKARGLTAATPSMLGLVAEDWCVEAGPPVRAFAWVFIPDPS